MQCCHSLTFPSSQSHAVSYSHGTIEYYFPFQWDPQDPWEFPIYSVSQKKSYTNLTMAITLSILNRFVTFLLPQRATNFRQNPYQFTHQTLSILLHYRGKRKTICTVTLLQTLSTLQFTSGKSISRHVSVQMVGILNTFCDQTHANNLYFQFSRVLVQ